MFFVGNIKIVIPTVQILFVDGELVLILFLKRRKSIL